MKIKIFLPIQILLIFCIIIPSCKKGKAIIGPEPVFKKWILSIKNLDFGSYSHCEAYPKNEQVFRDMYRNYYFKNVSIIKVDKPDDKDIQKDYHGNEFVYTFLYFQGEVVNRATRKSDRAVRGDAKFIRFLNTGKVKSSWLLSNRTFVTVNR